LARVFTSVEALASAIAADLPKTAVVGIDGWTGVGKTTLAKALSGALGGSMFDLDSALNRDRGSYVPSLRLGEIAEALTAPVGFLAVSGICLREVLLKAGREAHAHIYVKRMASWGWADEDELKGDALSGLGSDGGSAVRREMRRYHASWRPHLKANFEFHSHC